MDRKYLEQHLVAYLDGELAVTERQEFERELEKHPDLCEQLEQMTKLDKLARTTKIEMLAPGYFDNLAERIDAAVARQPKPQAASLLSRLARPWPRVVALVGSAAAVLLIALISQELYQPGVEQYSTPAPAMTGLLQDSGAGDGLAGRPEAEINTITVAHDRSLSDREAPEEASNEEDFELAGQPEPKPVAEAVPPVAIADEEKIETPAARIADIVSDAIVPDEVQLESQSDLAKKQKPQAEQPVRSKGATQQTALNEPEGIRSGLVPMETQGIERFGALHVRGGRSSEATLAQLDSAIAVQDSLGNVQEAMILSYQRARALHTADNLADARVRIESYLDKADPADREELENLLTQIHLWESQLPDFDSTD
jgi:hypothetical protein